MTNDMTRGNPVRLILAFMIPTYLGNIFQQFYNLVDSVVAGRYIGVNALAAIGSTTSLIFLVTGWLQGITRALARRTTIRCAAMWQCRCICAWPLWWS